MIALYLLGALHYVLFGTAEYNLSYVFPLYHLFDNFFLGGGHELSAYLIGGVAEMRAICVQGGRGVKKGRKTACILYQWPPSQMSGS